MQILNQIFENPDPSTVLAVAVEAGSSVSASPVVVDREGTRLLGFEAQLSLILERARVRYCEVSPHAPRTLAGVLAVSVADQHFGSSAGTQRSTRGCPAAPLEHPLLFAPVYQVLWLCL